MTTSKLSQEPINVEGTFNARSNEVWEALTNKNKMKEWYFDIKDFKPEVGFDFQFYAGDDKKQYLHICKIKEVVPGKKISYSWKYDYDPAITLLTFELFPEGAKTRLRLTHEGTHNFSVDHPELAKENFASWWNEIVNSELRQYLESKAILHHDHG